MSDQVQTPWSPEQVASLELRQGAGLFHEYTCATHSSQPLRPTREGWVCEAPGCSYTQNWALRSDTELTPDALWRMRLPD